MPWKKIETMFGNVRRLMFDLSLVLAGYLHNLGMIRFVADGSETVRSWHYNPELVEHAGNMFIICLSGLTAAYRFYVMFIKPKLQPSQANESV